MKKLLLICSLVFIVILNGHPYLKFLPRAFSRVIRTAHNKTILSVNCSFENISKPLKPSLFNKFKSMFCLKNKSLIHQIRATTPDIDKILKFDPEESKYANKAILAKNNDGKVIGIILYLIYKGNLIEITEIGIHDDFQKQGIGRALIDYLEAIECPQKMTLFSAPSSEKFYERIGFKPIGSRLFQKTIIA